MKKGKKRGKRQKMEIKVKGKQGGKREDDRRKEDDKRERAEGVTGRREGRGRK